MRILLDVLTESVRKPGGNDIRGGKGSHCRRKIAGAGFVHILSVGFTVFKGSSHKMPQTNL